MLRYEADGAIGGASIVTVRGRNASAYDGDVLHRGRVTIGAGVMSVGGTVFDVRAGSILSVESVTPGLLRRGQNLFLAQGAVIGLDAAGAAPTAAI
jgi:hypothetical protein